MNVMAAIKAIKDIELVISVIGGLVTLKNTVVGFFSKKDASGAPVVPSPADLSSVTSTVATVAGDVATLATDGKNAKVANAASQIASAITPPSGN